LIPQVPAGLQVLAEFEFKVSNPLPVILDAKEESCFFTWSLPHAGQRISLIEAELRNNSSNGWLQALHTNSKMGIFLSKSFN